MKSERNPVRRPRGRPATPPLAGMVQLAPLAASNLHEQAYDQLRQALMAGRFRPGDALTLRGLAAAMGTSIMPVRDAVLRLISEHALARDGRRVTVPVLDREQLADIWRFRIALEGEAASMAALRRSDADADAIARAADHVDQVQANGRIDQYVEANQAFHFTLYKAAHNDLLLSMIETLWLQIGPYLGQLVERATGLVSEVSLGHAQIVAAVLNRDPVAARRELAADLSESVDIFGPLDAALAEERQRA